MKKLFILVATVLVSFMAAPLCAAQVKVFVAEINSSGAQGRDDMKTTLQTLLTSRLNGAGVAAAGSAAEADVVVSGSYIAIGRNFSIDAVAKNSAGKTVARAFVQGESQDELIPAVGVLAGKLSAELSNNYSGGQANASPVPPASGGALIKPAAQETVTAGEWLSSRLTGAVNLLAVGQVLPDGSREIFLAEERRLGYYRQGSDLKLVNEVEFKVSEKIVSLDALEAGEGAVDIYVTIIRGGEPASQVWQVRGDKLQMVAGDLPYFFRTVSLSGMGKKLYAQAMGRDDDFYGEVAEAVRSGSAVALKNPIKMPRSGNIYSFNQFRDRDGKVITAVLNPDGYLIVYDQQMKELWRSNDRFGGSELFFQREDDSNLRVSGDRYRWVFMNQRIQVTPKGDVLVGRNDGFWVLGNARSYKRGAVHCLIWNGSSMEEKWRTRETQNYMPDYLFDDARKELLILQTVQRPGIATRGASSLSIRKTE